MESDYLIVVTTTDSAENAGQLAASLVEKRLAACAQVEGPITSTYRWEGAVTRGQEWKCSFKTTVDRYPQLEHELAHLHPYDTPEILAIPILKGSRKYLCWMDEELKRSEESA